MGLKEMLMDMALEKFMDELKNPNSPTAQKFDTIMNGDPANGVEGVFDKLTKQMSTIADDDNSQPASAQTINPKDIEALSKNYKRSTGQAVLDNVLRSSGTVLKGAGKGFNIYNSLLGDAMLAMQQSMNGSNAYSSPFFAMTPTALGIKARGAIGETIGDTAGTVLQDVSLDLQGNREKNIQTALMLAGKDGPPSAIFDSRKQMTKMQQGSTRKS